MLTRRDVLRMVPASALVGGARATDAVDFTRIDTHIHIHLRCPMPV